MAHFSAGFGLHCCAAFFRIASRALGRKVPTKITPLREFPVKRVVLCWCLYLRMQCEGNGPKTGNSKGCKQCLCVKGRG